MVAKEGQNQDDAVKSGESSDSPLTDLLQGVKNHGKEKGQARLKMSFYPVLIANLCLSVVLVAAIYKIGLQGFTLREKVEELNQQDTQLAETLKSIEGQVYYSKEEPKNEESMPAKYASENPPPVRKRTSANPSIISKIIYRVKNGDTVSGISERFGISTEQLCTWNRMEPSDPLSTGRVLIINKTMTADDLPYVAQDGELETADEIKDEGSETTARPGEGAEIGARGETDYISKKDALEQIAQARAEAQAAAQAVAQLQARVEAERKEYERTVARLETEAQKTKALEEELKTDYISRQDALEEIIKARTEAGALGKAIAQLQATLDSEGKISDETMAMLGQETQERKALEQKLATDYISRQEASAQIAEARAEAGAANKAVFELQAKLASERKEYELTVAMLGQETQERKALEQKLAADYIPKQAALEQINGARAEAQGAAQAIAQLQATVNAQRTDYEQTVARLEAEAQKTKALEAKLTTDYIPKETALEQIAQARAEAGAANKAVSELQAKLASERKEYEQTMAMLGQETQERKALEQKLAADYIPKQAALEQINGARAEAQAAAQAVAQLQARVDAQRTDYEQTVARLEAEAQKTKALEAKLTTDYIPKETALEQIAQARAEAGAANKAVSELQTKLASEREEQGQTVARLEAEAQKTNALEDESVAKRPPASRNATTEKGITRQLTSAEQPVAYPITKGPEDSTARPVKETVHIIQPGENLFRIGIKYGVPWQTLMKFNKLPDADSIYVGQRIKIPRRETAEARPMSLDQR